MNSSKLFYRHLSPEMIVLKPAPQLLNDDYIDETTLHQ
jgi:hypothetical protein